MYPKELVLSRKRLVMKSPQAGMGLPGAIFIIVVLALVVAALTNIEQRTGEALGQDVQSMRAFLAAESGAQAGLSKLFGPGESDTCNDACPSFGSLLTPDFNAINGLAGCGATVQCCIQTDGTDNYYTIRSTGFCGAGIDRAQRIVEVGARDNP